MTIVVTRDKGSLIWREHRTFIAVLAASTFGLLVVEQAAPLADLPSLGLIALALVDLGVVAVVWIRIRTRASWRMSWRLARQGPLSAERFGGLACAIVGTRVLLLTAIAWKSSLPDLHPFAFDAALHKLDVVLHGGMPWQFGRPLLASDKAMRALDVFYRFWYPALAIVVIRVGWQPPSFRRRRFLVALSLAWTLGSIAAVALSSAGPVYFARITGSAAYEPLVLRLTELQLPARAIQEALWGADGRGSTAVVAGIAAFPSLHVAVPALCAVRAWGESRRASLLWWAFTGLTFIGSVVLAWHYAIDGYAGVVLAAGAWWLAGRIS